MLPSHQISAPSNAPLFSTVGLNEGPRLRSRSLRTTLLCTTGSPLQRQYSKGARTLESRPPRLLGPDPLFTKTELRSERYNAYRKKGRNTSGRQKWNDELEDSFQLVYSLLTQTMMTAHVDFAPALRAIPNLGRAKTPCDPRICGKVEGPLYGRNEHIGHFIARQTDVRKNRKQISSHIQVFKSFQKGNAECTISTIYLIGMKANLSGMALVSKSAPSDLEPQPLDVYPPDPIQGPPRSIDSSDLEIPVGDHANVTLPTTSATDCFPLPSQSCNSYHSSFSESTSYRSSFSNSQHSAACTSYCSSFSESFGSSSQDFFPQPQNNSCCSHGDYGSTAANRYSRHEPEPLEYDHLDSTSYVDRDFEIPVREFHGLDVPSFSFVQESYSTSYTTSCAVRNNLLAHMAAPPRTRLSISHNHNTKNQTPFLS